MKASVLLTATVLLLAMAVHGKGDGGCIRRAAATIAPQPPKLDVVLSKHVRVLVTRPSVSRSRKEKEETEEVLVVEMGFGPDVHQISFLHVWLNLREGEEKTLFENAPVEPRYAGHYVVHREDIVAGQDKAARKFPIGGNLEAIGADGNRTVMVSIAPYVSAGKKGPYWYERQTLFVRAVYIVYEPKQHVTHRDGGEGTWVLVGDGHEARIRGLAEGGGVLVEDVAREGQAVCAEEWLRRLPRTLDKTPPDHLVQDPEAEADEA
ncbi:unnamed protein product [Triticum turgidum subsp. durum]|uniref:Polyphenol oxidase C-terminal domain-containing protein n=1 Tax=Triticum turgidum subsp. durum TaxID=4567 RepID=A0A9R1R163_TRITD|nr:unnamed protein product [Triticum turgidum subsp. durum]